MSIPIYLEQHLICVAVIDMPEDAVPLADALLAGGLNTIEVTFRTAGAADAITRASAKASRKCAWARARCSPPTR